MAEQVQSMDQLVLAKLGRLGPSQVEVFNCLMTAGSMNPCQTLHTLIGREALWKFASLVVGLMAGLSQVSRYLSTSASESPLGIAGRRVKTWGEI